MSDTKLHQADILDWARDYDGEKFHSLLTDPPYHLTSGNSKGGFMNKAWDGGDIAFRSETWAALAEHLHPGAFGMAFGGARTQHRLACAIEDAGLILHSMIGWVTGQSFPKASRVTSRANGSSPFCQCGDSQRLFPGHDFQDSVRDGKSTPSDSQGDCQEYHRSDDGQPRLDTMTVQDAEPRLNDAQEHNRSVEPLIDTQQDTEPSYSPCPAQHSAHHANQGSLRHGTTHSCIDACNPSSRTPSNKTDLDSASQERHTHHSSSLSLAYSPPCIEFSTGFPFCQECGKPKDVWQGHRYGRQALKGSLEPIIIFQKRYEGKPFECICETGAGALWIDGGRIPTNRNIERQLDKEPASGREFGHDNDGMIRFSNGKIRNDDWLSNGRWPSNFILDEEMAERLGDSGSPARFFYQVDYQLEQADPFRYMAKAARKERDAGLEGREAQVKTESWNQSTELADRMHGKTQYRNNHPCCKPLKLTQYLATLLLPPAEYAPRRILVPFAGSGSEMIGAGLAGWEHITGIELGAENVEIAEARLAHWLTELPLFAGVTHE